MKNFEGTIEDLSLSYTAEFKGYHGPCLIINAIVKSLKARSIIEFSFSNIYLDRDFDDVRFAVEDRIRDEAERVGWV